MSQLEDQLLTQPPTQLPDEWQLANRSAASAAEDTDIKNDIGNPADSETSPQHNEPMRNPHAQNSEHGTSYEYPSFQTAGKNVTIQVSEDSLSKARRLLSSSANTDGGRKAIGRRDELSTRSAPTEINNKAMNSEVVVGRQSSCPVFQTAGKNKTIPVSRESLLKANALFSDVGDESTTAAPAVGKNNNIGTSLRSAHVNTNKQLSNAVSRPQPAFQTAGKKHTIRVSSESLSKANTLFSGLESKEADTSQYSVSNQLDVSLTDNSSRKSTPAHAAAAQFYSAHTEMNVRERSSVPPTCQQYPTFQTAGKRQTIQISAESMAKANKLLSGVKAAPCDEKSSSGTLNNQKMNVSKSSEAYNGHSQSVTQNISIADGDHADSDLPDIVSGPCPMFQTAGKKQTIHVSAESLSKANDVLDRDQSSIQIDKGVRCNYADNGPSSDAVETQIVSCQNPSTTDPIQPVAMFQTAGKQQAIHVSAESLSKANGLFSEIESNAPEKVINHDASRASLGSNTGIEHTKGSLCASDTIQCNQTSNLASDKAPNDSINDSSTSSNFTTLVNGGNSIPKNANLGNKYNSRGTVINPYTNRKPAACIATKRVIAGQTSAANNNAKKIKASTFTVNNPYAKPKPASNIMKASSVVANRGRQSLVRNPYISKDTATAQSKAIVTNQVNKTVNQARSIEPPVCATDNNNNISASIVRPITTSRFFSMADRLPSRNVSYQPAEILSVGELYRFLYHRRANNKSSEVEHTPQPAKTSDERVYREITSVRITGVLLSSTYFDPDKDNAKLLDDNGQWLLIGDPLEKTRCVRQRVPMQHDSKSSSVQTSASNAMTHSTTAKENVMVGAPTPKPSASKVKPTTATEFASVATETPAPLQKKPTSILKSNKLATASRSCGLLNDKKRKFVYNKPSGRNSLSSSKGLLNAKKFQTPKRVNSDLSKTSAIVRRAASFSSGKKGVSLLGKTASNRIQSPSTIIQQHPSPIVPVWNGSTRDDNALDGSVIGDLVMVVGDIVLELCDVCKVDGQDPGEVNDATPDQKVVPSLLPVQDVRNASRFIASLASERDDAKECCHKCIKFLRARFVKNANGTDMHLQKEALKVRREYMKKRNEVMASLFPGDLNSFAIGSGPFL